MSEETNIQIEEQEIEAGSSDLREGNPAEKLYFCGLVCYLLLFLQHETLWTYNGLFIWGLIISSLLFLSVNLLLVLSKYDSLQLLLLFLSFIISIMVGLNAGFLEGQNLLYETVIAFLLVFGAKGIAFNKILKVYLLVGGTYCLITVGASLMGIIENLAEDSSREEALGISSTFNRFCFGYRWATNMANHVFFILLTYFVYVGRTLNFKEILLYVLIMYLIICYTGSRLSCLCVLLLLLLSLSYRRKWGARFLSSKLVCLFVFASIPFYAIVSYYVTNNYDENDLMWLAADLLLTGRLSLGYEALTNGGIPLFGQEYLMYGSVSDGLFYNYVDCSYIQLLVIYGIVYTVLLMIAYVFACKDAYKRKDFLLLYSILIAGISGVIAQHFIEMYMNPLLIALFASHRVVDDETVSDVIEESEDVPEMAVCENAETYGIA